MRLPLARRYDRNCVLACTAGQLVAATVLDCTVASIVIGESPFDVGPVAMDIELVAPAVSRDSAVIAAAGMIGFCLAGGLDPGDVAEGLTNAEADVAAEAAALIMPWIEDGRFAALVAALDPLRFKGKRKIFQWSRASTS